jgi:hypothetical protein
MLTNSELLADSTLRCNGETGADVLKPTVSVPVREHHSPRLLSKFKYLYLAPFRDSRNQNGPVGSQRVWKSSTLMLYRCSVLNYISSRNLPRRRAGHQYPPTIPNDAIKSPRVGDVIVSGFAESLKILDPDVVQCPELYIVKKPFASQSRSSIHPPRASSIIIFSYHWFDGFVSVQYRAPFADAGISWPYSHLKVWSAPIPLHYWWCQYINGAVCGVIDSFRSLLRRKVSLR